MTRDGDVIRSTLDDGTSIETDVALIVIGRLPNTDDIGLATVGPKPDEKGIVRVDDRCRTSVAGVFAIGDITGIAPYAHVAHRQGEIAAANALGRDERDDMAVVPAGVFVHPELATVGASEASTAAAKLDVKITRFPLQALGIAQAQGLASGWIKLIANRATGRLLGAAAVMPRAVEVIHEVALAIRHGLTVADVEHLIHAHPTYSEAVREAAGHWLGLPIHGLKG